MTRSIAVLVTCHNRVGTTLRCLQAVQDQQIHGVRTDLFVVDAGSGDGTADAVEARFPRATVIRKGDDLYWNAGMRVAFDHARQRGYDAYVWLNDDTVLDPDALAKLLRTEEAVGERTGGLVLVVGATRDPDTGEPTYGGVWRPTRWRRTRFRRVAVADAPVECETMNGNCVLVPAAVADRVGNLSPAFSHGMGDFDYGLRARASGARIWVAPGTIATCPRNPPADPARSMRQELRRIREPKGLPPREWATFTRRWAGPAWPLYLVSPYVQRVLARLLPRRREAS